MRRRERRKTAPKDKPQKRVGFEEWEMSDSITSRMKRLVNFEDIAAFFEKIFIVAFFVVLLFGVIFGVHPANNDNMKPRISAGDVVIYFRWDKKFVAREVCVYREGDHTRVGRIIARPGDEVSVTGGNLVVNGYAASEDDIFYKTPDYGRLQYPLKLGEDEFFILADYREGARDSRYFGPVKLSEIKGKVCAVIRWMNI